MEAGKWESDCLIINQGNKTVEEKGKRYYDLRPSSFSSSCLCRSYVPLDHKLRLFNKRGERHEKASGSRRKDTRMITSK